MNRIQNQVKQSDTLKRPAKQGQKRAAVSGKIRGNGPETRIKIDTIYSKSRGQTQAADEMLSPWLFKLVRGFSASERRDMARRLKESQDQLTVSAEQLERDVAAGN